MVATRERILTDNELHGSGFLDERALGVWMVIHHPPTSSPAVCHLFTNRAAAEAYVYSRCEEHPWRTPDHYNIQVWSVSETWPDADEDAT